MFLNRYPFKIAIISALGYVIGDFLSVSYSYYIVYGILVSVTPTIGQGIQEGIKRIAGIMSGGFIATMLVVNWEINSISVAVGVFLMIMFCYGIGAPQLIAQGGVTFSLVAIGHLSGSDQYYWERLVDNTMGVIVGTIATILLPPPNSALQFQQGIKQLLIQTGNLYKIIIDGYINQTFSSEIESINKLQKQIHQTLAKNTKLLQSAKLELSQGIGNSSECQKIENYHRLIMEITVAIQELKKVLASYERNQINKLLYPEISYLVQTTYQSFHALADFSVSKLTVSEQLSLPNLSEALNNLDSRIEEFDRIKNKNDYNLKEIIEASAFLDGLRAIANELLTVN